MGLYFPILMQPPHFADKETEAQTQEVTWQGSPRVEFLYVFVLSPQ